jgi:hypothetical protein
MEPGAQIARGMRQSSSTSSSPVSSSSIAAGDPDVGSAGSFDDEAAASADIFSEVVRESVL